MRPESAARHKGIGGFLRAGARLDLRFALRSVCKLGSLAVPSDFLLPEHKLVLGDSVLLPDRHWSQSLFDRLGLLCQSLCVPNRGHPVAGRQGRTWDQDGWHSRAAAGPRPDSPRDSPDASKD